MASTDLRTAAQQALEYLDAPSSKLWPAGTQHRIITALRAALAAEALQRLTNVQQEMEADLSRCPNCGGPADNGHDRSIPPSPYWCSQCMEEHYCDTHCTWADHAPECVMEERHFCPRCGKRTNGIHTCTPPAPLTDEVIADLWHQNGGFHHHFARAIERWLKGNP